jgi:hypothetical protein
MIEAMNEFGHLGYAAWFILLEMCAEKMVKNPNETFTNVHTKFRFSERLVRQKLRISRTKVEEILNFFQTFSLLSWEKVDNELHIEIPKLLESLDRDQRRARQVRDNAAPSARLEYKNKEYKNKEIRNKKEETFARTTRARKDHPNSFEFWDAYSNAFEQRWKVKPTRNAKVNSQINQLLKRIPVEEAPDIGRFYVFHNKSFYVEKQHPIGLLLADAESLRTQWLTNKQVTRREAMNAENKQGVYNAFAGLINEVEKNGK